MFLWLFFYVLTVNSDSAQGAWGLEDRACDILFFGGGGGGGGSKRGGLVLMLREL